MGAVLYDVANAVLVDLNADPSTNFGENFTAALSWGERDIGIPETDATFIDVVPAAQLSNGLHDRGGSIHYECVIHIGIRKKLLRTGAKTLDPQDVNAMLLLGQKIADFYTSDGSTGRPRNLSTLSAATYLPDGAAGASGTLEPVDKGFLRNNSVFLAIVQLSYQVIQAPA